MLLQLLMMAVQYAFFLAILPEFAAGMQELVPEILASLVVMLLGACAALCLAIVIVVSVVRFVRRTSSPWQVDTRAWARR